MANALYPLWKQALMREVDVNKSLDQGGDDPPNGVYCSLVNVDTGAYVYSDAHQFYSSVTDVQGQPSLITSPTVSGRIFTGDTVVYTNVTGPKIGALVLYRANDAGPSTGWRLVLYEDTGIIGLPMIPSGANIIVSWNVQGIFGL
jgi:hypothetical protein